MSSPGLELTSTDPLTNCIFTHDPRIFRSGKTTNIYEGQNREFGQWGGVRWTRCPVGPLSATDLRARPVHSKSAIRTIWRSQVSILSLEARQHHTPNLRNRWVKSRPFHITPSCLRLRTARRRLRPCCIAISSLQRSQLLLFLSAPVRIRVLIPRKSPQEQVGVQHLQMT